MWRNLCEGDHPGGRPRPGETGVNRMFPRETCIGGGTRAAARRRPWLFAAVAGALFLSGCGSSDQPKLDALGGPAVTASPLPTAATSAADAILAAYREFFARQTEISLADRDERRALLESIATEPALGRVLRGMFAADEIDEVGYGSAVVNPSVTSIDGDTATITDCQDTSKSGRKKRSDGKITTRGTPEAQVEATAKRGGDGKWRVATVDYRGAKC